MIGNLFDITGLSTVLVPLFLVSRSKAATSLWLTEALTVSRSSLFWRVELLFLKSTTELVLEPILDLDWLLFLASTMMSSYLSLPTEGSLFTICRPRTPGG